MSDYERQVWNSLEQHWRRRANRRGVPNWANQTLVRTKDVASDVAAKVGAAVPDSVAKPVGRAADAAMAHAARPVVQGVTALLDLVNDWALELNDPKSVEALARKHGHELPTFTALRAFDLKVCDQLLSRNTLTWRS